MRDINENCNLADYSRRKALAAGVALFSVCFWGRASFADGGGAYDFKIDVGPYDDEENDTDKPTVTYTQIRFGGLSQKAINNLFYDYEKKNISFGLRGFSRRMSPTILRMGYNDRRSTRNLLKDMRKIEPEKPRKARLKYELEYSTKLESDLKLSVRYLRSTNSPDLEEETGRLNHARGYKSGVRLWYRRPLEGSF